MLKKRLKIIKDKTILESIKNHEFLYEYFVANHAKLTVVFVADKFIQADVRIRVHLTGRGTSANIIGIILGHDSSKIALHTMQLHEAPETTSDLLVKTVLRDHAICLYDGGIYVAKKAQKTDAYQRNENLLLSPHVYSESKPSLEILANDVRCTHGATAGSINEEQLWYLSSRGISRVEAEKLIVRGFIQSACDRIEDKVIQAQVQQRFLNEV